MVNDLGRVELIEGPDFRIREGNDANGEKSFVETQLVGTGR